MLFVNTCAVVHACNLANCWFTWMWEVGAQNASRVAQTLTFARGGFQGAEGHDTVAALKDQIYAQVREAANHPQLCSATKISNDHLKSLSPRFLLKYALRARKSTTSATGIAVSTALCARLAALPTLRGPLRAYRPRRPRQARAREPCPAAARAQRR